MEKLHEFSPYCEKPFWKSKHLQVTQWMASTYGKQKHDAFNGTMEKKQPSTTQTSAETTPNSQQQQFQCEKAATASEQGKNARHQPQDHTARARESQRFNRITWKFFSSIQTHDGVTEKGGSQIEISEIISEILDCNKNFYITINDVKSHISGRNPSICNNI
ncbi:hypothetical protein O181_017222 [Austropuccinia psidii MF-1]|uniref:Uncharacterized protein n=1 Tax=Austropuccinia psidii MF-1 TaxID=1389203 RepID=A0A9Q3GSD7_9BASI|nr:hypothetical protein [Austropuccinia psidii MF-1]